MAIGIPHRVSVDYETSRTLSVSLIHYAIGNPFPGADHKEWLKQNVVSRFQGKKVSLVVMGFTTRSGSPAFNEILARNRGLIVANFLVDQGLQPIGGVQIQTLTNSPETPLNEDGSWRGVTVTELV